jgi:hypothetical protein
MFEIVASLLKFQSVALTKIIVSLNINKKSMRIEGPNQISDIINVFH